MGERIAITVNGQPVETATDTSVAAAVMNATGSLRRSVTGAPRGPLCGMGVCFECRLTMDGVAHRRSCQVSCSPAMRIETTGPSPGASEVGATIPRWRSGSDRDFDVLVIGAGPAGMTAASCAAQAGKRVAIVDDNPHAGGQIWRHDVTKSLSKSPGSLLSKFRELPIEILTATQILASSAPGTFLAESASGPLAIHAPRVILACGARERFLPFPGWTLPGVFGAGGLQALVKAGFPIEKQKVVVAGSGPLLLAVAAYLRGRGADLRLIAEQTPRRKLLRFGTSLLFSQPGKITEAIGFGWRLRGILYRAGCWPVCAHGTDRLASVTLTDGTRTWTEACDALACGFGLAPNLELPTLLGCRVSNGFVVADEQQQTSIPGIYAAGEITGIGGLDKAILEGQIAGWSAAEQPQPAKVQKQRAKVQRFVALLDDTFALREELRTIADDATIVCRCEDVTFGQLKRHAGARDAKLQTRCRMGPCQGRICGPALQFLLGWASDSVRPPIFPTALANLAGASES